MLLMFEAVYLAEHFAKAANRLPYYPKIWKPNLLVPVTDLDNFSKNISFIQAIVSPAGRVTVFKVLTSSNQKEKLKEDLCQRLEQKIYPFKEKNIFIETSVVEASEILSGTITIMQTVNSMFFPPNAIFYALEGEDMQNAMDDKGILEEASKEGLGIIVSKYNHRIGFSQEKVINLWIRRQSPNINLAILIAFQLEKNWQGMVRLIQAVERDEDQEEAGAYLLKLKNLMRLPLDGEIKILVGSFMNSIKETPPADINIFGMGENLDINQIHEVANTIQTSILFLRDSKHESALA